MTVDCRHEMWLWKFSAKVIQIMLIVYCEQNNECQEPNLWQLFAQHSQDKQEPASSFTAII